MRCCETLKRGEANQNIFFFRGGGGGGGGVISKIIFLRLLPNVHEQHQTHKKLGQLDPERGRMRARRAVDGAVSTPDLSFLSPHERKKKKSGGVSGRERKLRALKNKKKNPTKPRRQTSSPFLMKSGRERGMGAMKKRDNEREMQRKERSRQQSDGGK